MRGVSQRLVCWMTCMTLIALHLCLWHLASVGAWWGEHCIYVRQRVSYRKRHWLWTVAMRVWSFEWTWGPPRRAVLEEGEMHPDSMGTDRRRQALQVPNVIKQLKHVKSAKRITSKNMENSMHIGCRGNRVRLTAALWIVVLSYKWKWWGSGRSPVYGHIAACSGDIDWYRSWSSRETSGPCDRLLSQPPELCHHILAQDLQGSAVIVMTDDQSEPDWSPEALSPQLSDTYVPTEVPTSQDERSPTRWLADPEEDPEALIRLRREHERPRSPVRARKKQRTSSEIQQEFQRQEASQRRAMREASKDEERGLELIECEAYTTRMREQRLFGTASEGGARGSSEFGPPERDLRHGDDDSTGPADAGARDKERSRDQQESGPADVGAKGSDDTEGASQQASTGDTDAQSEWVWVPASHLPKDRGMLPKDREVPRCKLKKYALRDERQPHERRLEKIGEHHQAEKVRLFIVGSNWGGHRKRQTWCAQTMRAADMQLMVEASQVTLNGLGEAWSHTTVQPDGAPAVVWQHKNIELLDEKYWHWEGGPAVWRMACTSVRVRLRTVASSNDELSISVIHVNNEFAKKGLIAVNRLLEELRQRLWDFQTDVAYGDFNQAVFKHGREQAPADATFTEPEWARCPEAPLWGLPESLSDQACTGYLLRSQPFASVRLHSHGVWELNEAQARSLNLNARDRGWHRPSYITLVMSGHRTGRRVRSEAAKRRRAAKKWSKGHGYGATKHQTGQIWLDEEQRSTAEVVRAYERGLPVQVPRVQDRSWQSSWWSNQNWNWSGPAEAGRDWWQSWWHTTGWRHDVQEEAWTAWPEDTWNTTSGQEGGSWNRGSQQRWRRRSDAWGQSEDTWERRAAYKDRACRDSKLRRVRAPGLSRLESPDDCMPHQGSQTCKKTVHQREKINLCTLKCSLTGAGQRHGARPDSPAEAAREDPGQQRHIEREIQQGQGVDWWSHDLVGQRQNVCTALATSRTGESHQNASHDENVLARVNLEGELQYGYPLPVEVPLLWDHEFTLLERHQCAAMSSLPPSAGPRSNRRRQTAGSQNIQKATGSLEGPPATIGQTHYQTSGGRRGPQPASGHRRAGDIIRGKGRHPRDSPSGHSKTRAASKEALSTLEVDASSRLKLQNRHCRCRGRASSNQHAAVGSRWSLGQQNRHKSKWHRRSGCGDRCADGCSRQRRRGSGPTGERQPASRSCRRNTAGRKDRTRRSRDGPSGRETCRPSRRRRTGRRGSRQLGDTYRYRWHVDRARRRGAMPKWSAIQHPLDVAKTSQAGPPMRAGDYYVGSGNVLDPRRREVLQRYPLGRRVVGSDPPAARRGKRSCKDGCRVNGERGLEDARQPKGYHAGSQRLHKDAQEVEDASTPGLSSSPTTTGSTGSGPISRAEHLAPCESRGAMRARQGGEIGSADVDRLSAGASEGRLGRRFHASTGPQHESSALLTHLQRGSEKSYNIAPCMKSMDHQLSTPRDKRLLRQWCSPVIHEANHMPTPLHITCSCSHQPRGELTASPRTGPEAGAHMVCCIEQRIMGEGTPDPSPTLNARRCGWHDDTKGRPRRRGGEVIESSGSWVEKYLRVGEAQNPGPDKMAPLQTEIVKEDGTTEHIWLMCAHVKSRGMWRWQTTTAPRMVSGDKRTPWAALRSWIDKHKATLSLQGQEDLEAATLARHPDTNTPEPLTMELPKIDTQPAAAIDDGAPRGRLWGSAVPESEVLQAILSSDLSEVLSMSSRAQVRIPKSMLSLVESTLHWLSDLSADESDITAQAASVMLILAPKLLWPEPERQGHKSLPPWSRPRVIQERIRLIHAGKWRELLQLAQVRRNGSLTKAPPNSPEEIIKSEGRALLREVQRGRPGTAWETSQGTGPPPHR